MWKRFTTPSDPGSEEPWDIDGGGENIGSVDRALEGIRDENVVRQRRSHSSPRREQFEQDGFFSSH